MDEEKLIINTTGVHYCYGKNGATLSDINLKVERGSIYGFLGPNGSGKTTTLSLVLGLLKPQHGTIKIFGEDLAENRVGILRKVGSLIENPSLYGHLTARQNLEVYQHIYGVSAERIEKVLSIVRLGGTGQKSVKRFSLGMKQRLSLAIALLPAPELLILDEPTNGLDPAGIMELREIIRSLNREHGITMLISSHILAEVEKLVTHVGIITRGRMIFQGALKELQQMQQSHASVRINTSDNEIARNVLASFNPSYHDDAIEVSYTDRAQVAEMNRMLIHKQLDVYQISTDRKNDLEQLFMDLTSN